MRPEPSKQHLPHVTVLMAVYNAASYLAAAIDSILNQTFQDFEFIIVDDHSTDESWKILTSYKDPRIHLIQNPANLKAAAARNRGLAIARGDYIAPMDADDIALPHRLAVETAFLDEHPAIGLIGGNYHMINSEGSVIRRSVLDVPRSHHEATWQSFWTNPFAHSSVMCRTNLMRVCGGYPEDHHYGTEDYALWLKIASQTQTVVLDEPLLLYRIHNTNLSSQGSPNHLRETIRTATEYHEIRLGVRPPDRILSLTREMVTHPYPTAPEIDEAETLLLKVFSQFQQETALQAKEEAAIRKDLSRRLWVLAGYYQGLLSRAYNIARLIRQYPRIMQAGFSLRKLIIFLLGRRLIITVKNRAVPE
jgi:hypothetical protein